MVNGARCNKTRFYTGTVARDMANSTSKRSGERFVFFHGRKKAQGQRPAIVLWTSSTSLLLA